MTYVQGTEVTLTTDYKVAGDKDLIALSYKSLAHHVKQGAVPQTQHQPCSDK